MGGWGQGVKGRSGGREGRAGAAAADAVAVERWRHGSGAGSSESLSLLESGNNEQKIWNSVNHPITITRSSPLQKHNLWN